MTPRFTFAAFTLAFLCCLSGAAQDNGYWRAASTNARAITGDISIGGDKVFIDFLAFRIAQARTLGPAEVAAAFDADVNAGGNGVLYHLNIPPDRRFLHHNTLCGADETQWMATYVSGRTLQVAFFSGQNPPVITIDALQNSTSLCGTFTYSR